MTDERHVLCVVEMPVTTYRALERAAARRGLTVEELAGRVLAEKAAPTFDAMRRDVRRREAKRLWRLGHTQPQIAAMLHVSLSTISRDLMDAMSEDK